VGDIERKQQAAKLDPSTSCTLPQAMKSPIGGALEIGASTSVTSLEQDQACIPYRAVARNRRHVNNRLVDQTMQLRRSQRHQSRLLIALSLLFLPTSNGLVHARSHGP